MIQAMAGLSKRNPKKNNMKIQADIERISRDFRIENCRRAREVLNRHPNLIPMALGFPNIFTLLIPPKSVPDYPKSWQNGSVAPNEEKIWRRYQAIKHHDSHREVRIREPSLQYPVRWTLRTLEALKKRKAVLPKNADIEERLVYYLSNKDAEFDKFTKKDLAQAFFSEKIFKNTPQNKLVKILTGFPPLRRTKNLQIYNHQKGIVYFYYPFIEMILSEEMLEKILTLPLDHIPKDVHEWILFTQDNLEARRPYNKSGFHEKFDPDQKYNVLLAPYKKAIREVRSLENDRATSSEITQCLKKTKTELKILLEERHRIFRELLCSNQL